MATKRAICVGLNYPGTCFPLSGCHNDAIAWTKLLNSKPFNYSQVVTMLDCYCRSHDNYPTKSTFISTLVDLLKVSKAGDTLTITFSGHGKQMVDQDNDEDDGMDSALVFFNGTSVELLSDDQFQYIIMEHIKPGVKLRIILDCCYAGTGLDLPFNYVIPFPSNLSNRLKDSTGHYTNWYQSMNPRDFRYTAIQTTNIIMLAGCQDRQKSLDAWYDGVPMGAMTQLLVQLLDNKKTITGVNLSWIELLETITFQLDLANDVQQPQISCSHFGLLEDSLGLRRVDI